MNSRIVTFAVLLAIGTFVAPAAVPALESIDPAPSAAAARPCILGSSSDCIIPIYCIREPCPHFP